MEILPHYKNFIDSLIAALNRDVDVEKQIELYRKEYRAIQSVNKGVDLTAILEKALNTIHKQTGDILLTAQEPHGSWKRNANKLDRLAGEILPPRLFELYSNPPAYRSTFNYNVCKPWKQVLIDYLTFEYGKGFFLSNGVIKHIWHYLLLVSVLSCCKRFGLHLLINRRPKKFQLFNLRIELLKDLEPEYIFFADQLTLEQEFLAPYRNGQEITVNGRKIKYSEIQRIKVSMTLLKKEEFSLHFQLKGIDKMNNENAFHSFRDVTNLVLRTSHYDVITGSNWNLLHPDILEIINPVLSIGDYGAAVQKAIIHLNDIVKAHYQEHSGETKERDGKELFSYVFSSKNPVVDLSLSDQERRSSKNQGYISLFQGIWLAFRNPQAHTNTIDLSETDAFDILILASHLLRKFQKATNLS